MRKSVAINVIVILALVVVSVSFARIPIDLKSYDFAQESYLRALNSENPGVRTSAMLQIMKLRVQYPEENFKLFVTKIKKISNHDPYLNNRTYAYLANMFLECPHLATQINPKNFQDPDSFFNSLYTKVTENQLALQ